MLIHFLKKRSDLLTALGLALMAFFIFEYWALSLVDQAEQIPIVTAKSDLVAPRILTEKDLTIVHLRRDSVPKTALVSIHDALGLTLTHSLSAAQILTTNELLGKLDPELGGFEVPIDQKGFALPNQWLAAPFPKIKKDDSITILVSHAPRNVRDRNTVVIAQHLPVLRVHSTTDNTIEQAFIRLDILTAGALLEARANNYLMEVLVDGLASASSTSRLLYERP